MNWSQEWGRVREFADANLPSDVWQGLLEQSFRVYDDSADGQKWSENMRGNGNFSVRDENPYAGDFVRTFEREVNREVDRRKTSKISQELNDARARMEEILGGSREAAPPAPTTQDISNQVQDAVTGYKRNRKKGVSYLNSVYAGETGNVSGRKAKPENEILGSRGTLLGT